jgi:hypothetical protein
MTKVLALKVLNDTGAYEVGKTCQSFTDAE